MSDYWKKNGFDSETEFLRLVGQADLSTPEKEAAFNKWRDEDGTRAGLVELGLGPKVDTRRKIESKTMELTFESEYPIATKAKLTLGGIDISDFTERIVLEAGPDRITTAKLETALLSPSIKAELAHSGISVVDRNPSKCPPPALLEHWWELLETYAKAMSRSANTTETRLYHAFHAMLGYIDQGGRSYGTMGSDVVQRVPAEKLSSDG